MAWGIRLPWAVHKEQDPPLDGIEQTSSSAPSDEKKPPYNTPIDLTQAATDIPKIAKSHQYDPNLTQDKINELHGAAEGDAEAIKKTEEDFTEDSPYAEVRAAVRNTDSGGPANTVRAWMLGMVAVTICSGLNMFLSMRSPAISFPAVVVQL